MSSLKKSAILFLAFVLLTVACRSSTPSQPGREQPPPPVKTALPQAGEQQPAASIPPPTQPVVPTPTDSEVTSPEPTEAPEASAPEEEPTMTECRQWLASSQDLNAPIACTDWDFFREKFFAFGGGAFPVGDGRYYLAWFPENWEDIADRKVIVSLHGTGGCAEWMLNQWYQTTSPSYSWALVALQYYDPDSGQYDGDEVIYKNLETALDEIQAHCPVDDSQFFYHGFSRGSAQSFPVALLDRAGRQFFSAFISDSGAAGKDYPALKDQPADALSGAHFWMWCGENDVSAVDASRMTCDVMEENMVTYVEEHGGVVDALIRQPDVGHGMFDPCDDTAAEGCKKPIAEDLGPSLSQLFEYIESFAGR